MNNKPNPELIDEENPEWTAAMFNTAKTADELLPQLANGNDEAVEGFKRGWQEILRGEYEPIEHLWDDKT
jgi:hypothetical protein